MSEDFKALEKRASMIITLMEKQLDYLYVSMDLFKSASIDVEWQLSVDKRLITMQYELVQLTKKLNL